jgi:hypothetical protein
MEKGGGGYPVLNSKLRPDSGTTNLCDFRHFGAV